MKQARKRSSYACNCKACWPHTTTSLLDMGSRAGKALKGSLSTTAQAQLKQPPSPQRLGISEAMLHLTSCNSKLWQASVTNRAAHKSANHHHHFTQMLTKVHEAQGRHTPSIQDPQAAQQASMSVWQAAATRDLWQAASCFGMHAKWHMPLSCSQLCHPLLLSC